MVMRRWIVVAGLALCATARAGDEGDLSSRVRASAAKSTEAVPGVAPFAPHAEPAPAFTLRLPGDSPARPAGCMDGLAVVCYDSRNRGLVYRGAREFMPRVQGFTPEGVALRHDRLILRYSFR
jgi:hypothetical protein